MLYVLTSLLMLSTVGPCHVQSLPGVSFYISVSVALPCISSGYISFFSRLTCALDLQLPCHNLAAQAVHPGQLVAHHHIWGPVLAPQSHGN